MKKRGNIMSRIAPIAVALLCISMLFSLFQCQMTINSKKQELASVQAQLDTQLAANEELSRSLANGDSAIIERIAREQGYAMPNERVFVDISGK